MIGWLRREKRGGVRWVWSSEVSDMIGNVSKNPIGEDCPVQPPDVTLQYQQQQRPMNITESK
jgi:hypothetical protein